MRVMLDTNVIISDLIFCSPTIVRAEEDIAKHHELLLCTYVVDELREVIKRKWPQRTPDLERLLQKVDYELVLTPSKPPEDLFDIRDPKDYPVLYSAMLADADVLVTGDKDFGEVVVDRPEILTPAEYVNLYAEED